MEITRNDIIVTPQSFLEFLVTMPKINTYNYNCIDNNLVLDVQNTWDASDDLVLDAGITASGSEIDYIKIVMPNVVINSIREFTKKYRKQSTIKNKLINYSYNKTTNDLILTVKNTWTTENTTTLDNVIDALVGYDVVTSLMDGYEVKAKDGKRYYNKKRSEQVEKIMLGTITSEDAFVIDTKLKNVKDSLLTGDWITSQAYLGLTTVEGAYTQELKDELNLEIGDYITNNYS